MESMTSAELYSMGSISAEGMKEESSPEDEGSVFDDADLLAATTDSVTAQLLSAGAVTYFYSLIYTCNCTSVSFCDVGADIIYVYGYPGMPCDFSTALFKDNLDRIDGIQIESL